MPTVTANAGAKMDDSRWHDAGVARITFAGGGRILSADPAACALVGLPPGGLDGVHWTSLVPHASTVVTMVEVNARTADTFEDAYSEVEGWGFRACTACS
jgi:PAS domain-containing protein